MDSLLLTNVVKAINLLAGKVDERRPPTPSSAGPAPIGVPWLHPTLASPLFSVSVHGCLESTQDRVLGFYVLRNIIRAILIGVRPLEAGNLLLSKHFLSAAVASYYTSAFHLAAASLALHGRILFEAPQFKEAPKKGKECIVARLNKKNLWSLEERGRSHSQRWGEFGLVYRESPASIDPEFIHLLSNLIDYGPDPFGEEEAVMSDGLKRLAHLRHEALYQGFGFDEFAFDLAANEEGIIMNQRAEAFQNLCLYLMRTAIAGLFTIAASTPAETLTLALPALLKRTVSPPFEEGDATGVGDRVIAERINHLKAWLLGREALTLT